MHAHLARPSYAGRAGARARHPQRLGPVYFLERVRSVLGVGLFLGLESVAVGASQHRYDLHVRDVAIFAGAGALLGGLLGAIWPYEHWSRVH